MFKNVLMPMNNAGIDFWWLDWQQEPFDKEVKNLSNTWWLNYIFFSQMERERQTRPLIYHRWGGLGNHRYQVGFSGDTFISWASLDYQTYFNSTASNVLYGYWSHDIGGHQGVDHIDPELYVRWMQFGAFSPILRSHSTKIAGLTKEPWVFSNEVSDILRGIIRQRYNMVPYIYTMAREAYETGLSLCRPMYYDYPETQEAYDYRNQYMFGNDVMVAPATSPMKDGYTEVKVWLPEGQWYEFASGKTLQGGQVLTRYFALDEYPIYIKAGAVLPMYNDKVMNLNGKDETIVLNVIPGKTSSEFTLYEDNGDDKNYQKEFADMYHIYAMDPRYKKKVETDFSDRMKESLDNAEDSFSFRTGNAKLSDEVDLTAQNGEVLKYQIRQQMKYEMGSDLLKTWTNNIRTSTDLQKKITDIKGQISKDEKEAQRQQENTINDQKDEKKDKEEIEPSAKKDPRKGFMKLLKEGSVSLVMGKKKVSDLPIDIVYGKEDTTKQKIWNFMNRKTMEKEMDKLNETSSADSFASELPAIFYAQKYFHCLTDTSKKEGTKYEIEYLIAGK